MKMLLVLGAVLGAALGQRGCGAQKEAAAHCLKGRLEVKGMCANYTIKVVDGPVPSWAQASWTDEQTGKAHNGVFRLANPCVFPDSLEEGDAFYFVLDSSKQEGCNVCMAFYPTPEKTAAIKVVKACP